MKTIDITKVDSVAFSPEMKLFVLNGNSLNLIEPIDVSAYYRLDAPIIESWLEHITILGSVKALVFKEKISAELGRIISFDIHSMENERTILIRLYGDSSTDNIQTLLTYKGPGRYYFHAKGKGEFDRIFLYSQYGPTGNGILKVSNITIR